MRLNVAPVVLADFGHSMHRRLLLGRAVASAMLALAGARVAHSASAGGLAPTFDLPGPTSRVRLADLRGRFVFLDFWASWCAPCKLSFPWMRQMQATYGPLGLQVVAISVDARRGDAERFLAAAPVNFTIAFDPAGDTPKAYAIKAMPSSFLIGPDGRVVLAHAGFREDDKAGLEERIRAALPRA
jgi:peroxiredoxin